MTFKYPIGTKVYHVLGGGEECGLVTGILLRPGMVVYYISWPDREETLHYELELTAEKSYDK